MKLNELYENANYADECGMMFNCDVLKLLSNIEDKSIDLIVTDPPYKTTSRGSSGNSGGMLQNVVLISEYDMPSDFECIWSKKTLANFDSNRKQNKNNKERIEKLFIYKRV